MTDTIDPAAAAADQAAAEAANRAATQAADNARVKEWEKSIVTMEVTRKIYDYQHHPLRNSN